MAVSTFPRKSLGSTATLAQLRHMAGITDGASPYAELPLREKICTNCKFCSRSFNIFAILDRIFTKDSTLFYRCVYGEKIEEIDDSFDPVTGGKIRQKTKIVTNTYSCKIEREHGCGKHGVRWEPNEKWRKNKKNLFTQIKVL